MYYEFLTEGSHVFHFTLLFKFFFRLIENFLSAFLVRLVGGKLGGWPVLYHDLKKRQRQLQLKLNFRLSLSLDLAC